MALLYRGHFGFKDVRLSSNLGEDTSILYGFVRTLLNLLQLSPPPTHLAVVFDAAGKTFRWAHAGRQRRMRGRRVTCRLPTSPAFAPAGPSQCGCPPQ